MDQARAPANQRIENMSFEDLTLRAASAWKLKPAETAKTPSDENEPMISGK